MTDKKLTDNEIVKALECCSCETIMYCEDQCPFYKKCMKDEQLSKYALDLINRQKAEIDELQLEIKSYNAENNKLKAENSNLTSDLTSLQNDLTSAKAEIERLTIRLRKAEHQLDDAMKMYNTIKAEAYKEFAEEIFELFPTDKSVTYITRVTVKHILKELKGDDK